MQIDDAYLQETALKVLDAVQGLAGSAEVLRDNWDQARGCVDSGHVDHSLSSYLEAEFDVVTRGGRGLGRISTHVPRLGAYYRKKLRGLSEAQVASLKAEVTSLIVKSYVFAAMHSSRKPSPRDAEAEYQRWVPMIYTLDLASELGERGDLLDVVIAEEVAVLREALRTQAGKISIFRTDKLDAIMQGYIAAGISLYFAQVV